MENANQPSWFVSKSIETYLKTAIIFLIIYLSFLIFKPFLLPVLWGAIMAIALYPLHEKFTKLLGGRSKLSAILITLAFLVIILVPAKSFVEALVGLMQDLSAKYEAGTLTIPAPPEEIAVWPVVGEKLYDIWEVFANNLRSGIELYSDQFKNFVLWFSQLIMGITGTILIFIVAFIIAGVFLNMASGSGYSGIYKIGDKLMGINGGELINNAVKTVRSVMTGVLGTAVIQSLILSVALFVFHVPGAPILSIIILFMAIAQLPVIILIVPLVIYMFTILSGLSAVLFTIWMIAGAVSDNIFKPMLLGRGLKVPMLVILIGAIGGMLLMGIVGLFIGAVILSVAYEIMQLWLKTAIRKS